MITLNHPVFHIARITIECQSPLSIKDDDADPTLDVTLFRDAHGNPTIAGTSIAGVLRHLAHNKGMPESLFGKDEKDNHASPLQTSFGFIHDANNQPIMGSLQTRAKQQSKGKDELINFLANVSPILRDQVKHTEQGTATDAGKFDVSALPKGTRFTFELSLASSLENKTIAQQHWQQLIQLIHSPLFRLGGLTHRGFGQLKIIGLTEKEFNFTQPNDLQQWKLWKNSNWTTQPASTPTATDDSLVETLNLNLEAEDFWRIGDGATPLQDYSKTPDASPYTETVIEWQKNQAHLKYKQLSVPATGIKGALRHRTLYHLRKIEKDWQGDLTDKDLAPLFGIEASHQEEQGNVGAIIINDLYPTLTEKDLPKHTKVMMHNAIDRFTGGTINGALFSEELLYQVPLECQIHLNKSRLKKVTPNLIQAFTEAITDLGEGRLALGAGSSKGHGYFSINNLASIQAQLQNIAKELA